MGGLLTPDLLEHIGDTAPPRTERVSRRDIRKYAVATGQRQRKFLDGDEAPPLYYIALFWEVVEQEELTPDGVFIDKLVPEFPLKRAMAGAWNVEFFRAIHPGDVLVANRTLSDIYEKEGSSGPLIFYELTTEITTEDGQPVLTEKATRIMR